MFAKLSSIAAVLLPAALFAAEFKISDGSSVRVDEIARDIVRIRRSADGVWRVVGGVVVGTILGSAYVYPFPGFFNP